MVLKKIYFDSFKSLVNEHLLIKNNCTGIVGINESGKSNILQAIRILNDEHRLDSTHVPKISKTINPKLRFEFIPRKDQENSLKLQIIGWIKTNSLLVHSVEDISVRVEFEIEYDLETNIESRKFKVHIIDFKLDDLLILKNEFFEEEYFIFYDNDFIPIQAALVIPRNALDRSEKELALFKKSAIELKKKLDATKKEKEKIEKKETLSDDDKIKLVDLQIDLEEKENNLRNKQSVLDKFNIDNLINEAKKDLDYLEGEIEKTKLNIDNYLVQINTLKSRPRSDFSVQDKGNLTRFTNALQSNKDKLKKHESDLIKRKEKLTSLKNPLSEKYIQNLDPLSHYISQLLEEDLIEYLPKVVFWEYSNDYILKSKTKFSEILNAKKLSEISRPLVNIFRIGLKINNLDEIKKHVKLIQGDDGERSRFGDLLNEKINKHIHNVWEDYDQNIKISVEEHQIRIEFFDPKFQGKSYFNMDEKSQGAQTFLSFLMTIGAEAAHGVLKNTILLLDEPETHLHPSGVRYMLKELIKISEKNNIVVYATHSIFMIDTNNYERHVYLKKKNERTFINLSEKNRIGYFMQEEVLFGALDFDLEKDLDTRSKFNFVFEGEGDVLLFKHYYENILKPKDHPFELNKSTFYQGGKCSDIINFLKKNPLKLGTKWIFIIDRDLTADKLKYFILNQYENYIDKEIFIYQYSIDDKGEVQLEDLLSDQMLKLVYKNTCKEFNHEYDEDKIASLNINDLNYAKYNSEILNLLSVSNNNYKGIWKDILNNKIDEEINNIKTKKSFDEKIPKYLNWANELILDLNSKIKK